MFWSALMLQANKIHSLDFKQKFLYSVVVDQLNKFSKRETMKDLCMGGNCKTFECARLKRYIPNCSNNDYNLTKDWEYHMKNCVSSRNSLATEIFWAKIKLLDSICLWIRSVVRFKRFVQWAGAVGQNSPCRTGIKISHTHTHTQILSLFWFNWWSTMAITSSGYSAYKLLLLSFN